MALHFSLKSAEETLQTNVKMEPNETQGVDQASGTSIFWALVALALNAVTEPSRIGSFFSQLLVSGGSEAATQSGTSFDPLRSSPVFCAAETILDILFLFVDPRPQKSLSDTDAVPRNHDATEPLPVDEGQEQEALPDSDDEAPTPPPEPRTDITSPTINRLRVVAFAILFFFLDPEPEDSLSDTEIDPSTSDATETLHVAERTRQDAIQDCVNEETAPPGPTNNITSPATTTLKVIAFFLGVLPQAIKLFSMSGIAGTQTCAALFLAASVTRATGCKSSSHFARSVDVMRKGTPRAATLTLLLFTLAAHLVLYIWLYFNIAGGLFYDDAQARAARERSGSTMSLEVAAFARSAYMILGMLTILVSIVLGRSLTTGQWLPVLMLLALQERYTPAQLAASSTWLVPPPHWLTNLSRAFALFAMSIIGCLQVSALFIAIGRVLSRLAAERAARSGGRSDGGLQLTSTEVDEPVGTSRFHQIMGTLWQGLVWLKDVFVEIREECDNEAEWRGTLHEEFGASIEQIGLAWGIFNLLTALLYYLVVFDSTGTSSPSWTSVLG